MNYHHIAMFAVSLKASCMVKPRPNKNQPEESLVSGAARHQPHTCNEIGRCFFDGKSALFWRVQFHHCFLSLEIWSVPFLGFLATEWSTEEVPNMDMLFKTKLSYPCNCGSLFRKTTIPPNMCHIQHFLAFEITLEFSNKVAEIETKQFCVWWQSSCILLVVLSVFNPLTSH